MGDFSALQVVGAVLVVGPWPCSDWGDNVDRGPEWGLGGSGVRAVDGLVCI